MRPIRLLAFITALLLLPFSASHAQMRETPQSLLFSSGTSSSTERPVPIPLPRALINTPISSRNYIGAEVGLTYSFMPGSKNFFWTYSEPTSTGGQIGNTVHFDNMGSGFGFLVGGLVDLSLSDAIGLEGKVHYLTNSTGNTEEHTMPCPDPTNPNALARAENNYTLTLSSIGIDALLRVQLIPDSWYALGGFGFSSLSSNNIKGHQTIDSSDNNCSYIDAATGLQTGITTIDVPGNSIDNFFNTTRADVKLGVGTYIPTGGNVVISPELQISIPLTPLFNSDNESVYSSKGVTTPKLWYVALSVGIKFPFGGSSDEAVVDGGNRGSIGSAQEETAYHLKGRVTDKKTGKPVDANMTVVDLKSNEVVNSGRTDDDGNYDLKVNGPGRYSVTADANNYLFGTSYFEVDDQGRILRGRHDIQLSSTTNGRTRLLIFFDFDKADLKTESFPELSRAVQLMKANPSMDVEIAGYTDSKGSPEYNQKLSQRRAQSVVTYLIEHGIDPSRLTAKGYGEQDPVASNDTDEGRAENRRVEFVVTNR